MKKMTVALIDCGEDLPIDLDRLARLLNRRQAVFQFETLAPITSVALGEPDVDDQWYQCDHLLEAVRSHLGGRDCDLVTGITRVRMTKIGSGGTGVTRDYFSMSDFSRATVICVHSEVSKCRGESKDLYQYVAFLLMCELLLNVAKTNLSHLRRDDCLFDECEERALLAQCLERGRICEQCRATLKTLNVSGAVISEVTRVLHWFRRNTWGYSVKKGANNATMLSLGGAVGWAGSALFSSSQVEPGIIAGICIAGIAPAAAVSVYYRYRHQFRKRS